jgi:hypothetical protein
LGDATLPDLSAELPQLPDYEKKLGSLRETVKLLLTPEREARQKQLEDLEKRPGNQRQDCRSADRKKQV